MRVSIVLAAVLLVTSTAVIQAQSFVAADTGKNDPAYQSGLSALDARNWEQAVGFFRESAKHNGANADAALYWMAYAQSHAGEREEALSTLQQLEKNYASSRWVNDGKALEVEIQARNGNPVTPAAEQDEELKLLALNSLMGSDPEKALPVLRRLLDGSSSDQLKDRALFVLVQNSSPEARKLVADTARGSHNPELQLKAIHYLGMMGGQGARTELASIYGASSDERVKREILKGLMISGARDQLLVVARGESNPELRREAIHQLAVSGGKDELWQLFQTEGSNENKREILHALFITGDSSRLADAAKTLKDRELKMEAIKSLGLLGGNGRPDVLVSIYQSDSDPEVRRAVLHSLFLQQNGKALVDLARVEKDPQMKQEIVRQMSLVHSKEVTDYMMEVLK